MNPRGRNSELAFESKDDARLLGVQVWNSNPRPLKSVCVFPPRGCGTYTEAALEYFHVKEGPFFFLLISIVKDLRKEMALCTFPREH